MPMRNVALQFGLLAIPAKLSKATETKVSNTNMCVGQPDHDKHEATPVKAPYTCPTCGPIKDYDALVKGIKQGNTYAIVSQEEVAEKKAEFTAEYKHVMNFVAHPAADFYAATAPGDKINYAVPAATGECKPGCKGCPVCRYQLLVRLVSENPDIALVSLYTPVSATGLYVLTARHGVLVLEERVRTQELKAAPEVPEPAEFKDKLYAALEGFLEVEPYDPDDYEDKYAAALREMAEKSEEIVAIASGETRAPAAGKVQSDEDLLAKMAALKTATTKKATKKAAPKKKAS